MADHFIETLEYEQDKNLGLVYLKVSESVKKRMILKYIFVGWLVRVFASQDHSFFLYICSGIVEEVGHSGSEKNISFISLCIFWRISILC